MSMDPIAFDDLLLKCLERSATPLEEEQLIQAMEADRSLWLRAQDQAGLHAGLKALQGNDYADYFAARVLQRVTHQEQSRDFAQRTHERLRSSRGEYRTSRRRPVSNGTPGPAIIYASAAAAALLVTTGLLALWLSPALQDRPLTPREKRRHEVIVQQLRELNLERKAVETARARRLPRPKPAPPKEPTLPNQQEEAEEAEEAARFIEARRRFVMRQLRQFQGRQPLPDGLDVDELVFDETSGARSEGSTTDKGGPIEVGQVLDAQEDLAGVLIREAEVGPLHLKLTKHLTLLRGDRIETAGDARASCTSVRLTGGATIDMDRATSVELLGRDNVRFKSGRIYAHINVPFTDKDYRDQEPPFSLETEAGRFLTHELRAELHLSANEILNKDLTARVDGGKVHLVNQEGHVVGLRGQELHARKDRRPSRKNGFSERIWRGCERNLPSLPFGLSNPIVFSSYAPLKSSGTYYALGLALRKEIDLRGVQTAIGKSGKNPDQVRYFRDLQQKTRTFQQLAPRRIPRATLGVLTPLQVPTPKVAARTRAERSDAALQILAAAESTSPSKPLLVLCHGSMTDVACAWLMDPTITERVIVVGERSSANNEWTQWICDPWACEIAITHFRCVIVYHGGLKSNRELVDQITDPKWVSMKTIEVGRYNSFGLLYHVANADAEMTVRRVRFSGTKKGDPVFERNQTGNIWEIWSRATTGDLQDEFRRIFVHTHN